MWISLFRWIMPVLIVLTSLYLYIRCDRINEMEMGGAKWKTHRYLTLFSTCIIICIILNERVLNKGGSAFGNELLLLVFITVYGNMSPKIAYNRTLGLRLPWTLRSASVWRYAHRVCGYMTFPCAACMLAACLMKAESIYIVSLVLWLLVPMVTSFFYSRKEGIR